MEVNRGRELWPGLSSKAMPSRLSVRYGLVRATILDQCAVTVYLPGALPRRVSAGLLIAAHPGVFSEPRQGPGVSAVAAVDPPGLGHHVVQLLPCVEPRMEGLARQQARLDL